MSAHSDVIVIGAGPAGCAAAIFLARLGKTVTLLDKARFPRAKVCGEGVMPAGVKILDELGVLPAVEKAGRPFRGIRLISPNGREANGLFPNTDYGIAIPRERLDTILVEQARAHPNIQVLEASAVTRPLFKNGRMIGVECPHALFAASHLIADGASSPTTHAMDMTRQMPKRKRYGLRAHFSGVEGLGNMVEVFFVNGGEIYLAPQTGDGQALIAMLVEESQMAQFAGHTQEGFREMIRSCAPIAKRMGHAIQQDKILGLGPLGGRMKQWCGPGWWLVGDAASSFDPLTGEGISLALANGRLAAHEVLAPSPCWHSYTIKRWQLVWKKTILSKLLLTAALSQSASNLIIGQLARHPIFFAWLF